MLMTEEFRGFKRETKSDYLFNMLYPQIKDDNKKKKSFLVFIYNAEDEDLVEFYDAIIHPEKRRQYMDNQNNKIRQWNEELKKISKDFASAKMQMYESLDKNDADYMLKHNKF